MNLFSIYSQANRTGLVAAALILIFAIGVVDLVTPDLPLGYLYLIPILLLSGFLERRWIAFHVLLCAALTALLSRYPFKPAMVLFVMASIGFTGTGFFVSEVVRNRQNALENVRALETQIRLRWETEEQLRSLVESSPLAILTIDAGGQIRLANDAAQSLFAPGDHRVVGRSIAQFLPALETVMHQSASQVFRTQIRCRGIRTNGDVFLAAAWFATSATTTGSIVSVIVVDFSEDLRDREDLSLEHLLKNAKILVGAIAHEIRNLCSAISVVYKNLSRLEHIQHSEDFRALGTLIEGLENLSLMELRPSWAQEMASVELASVLDELRIVIEPSYNESNMEVDWCIQEDLPLINGERYGLLQVFLNLARNSQRAMEYTATKCLTIRTMVEPGSVVIRFEDTGTGVSDPSGLFQPFHKNSSATGLGLYVSRAIVRSFSGDLRYEPRSEGSAFVVILNRFIHSKDSQHD